jgi:hypothetical protein
MSTIAAASSQALTPTQALADYYSSQLQNGNTLAESLLQGTPPEFQELYSAASASENSSISGVTGASGSTAPTPEQQYQSGLLNNATVLAQSLGLGNHVDTFA